MKEIAKRLLSLVIVLACFLSLCLPALAAPQSQAQEETQAQDESSEETGGLLDQAALAALKNYTYGDYLSDHADAAHPQTEISLKYDEHQEYDNELKLKENELPYAEFTDEYFNITQKALISDEDTIIGWTFSVPEDGMYSIKINYYNFVEYTDPQTGVTYKSRSSSIAKRIYIDGKIPFYEARQFYITRNWMDQNEVVRDSVTDNDIRPFQQEMSRLSRSKTIWDIILRLFNSI